MPQPGRSWDRSADTLYRYGYNGMETDGEVKGERGNHYTTYFRQYDPRLGRWWSNDPVVQAGESPYAAMYNNPIAFSDPFGNQPTGEGSGAEPMMPGFGCGVVFRMFEQGSPTARSPLWCRFCRWSGRSTPPES